MVAAPDQGRARSVWKMRRLSEGATTNNHRYVVRVVDYHQERGERRT